MSRQLQASKELLILGDSNVERNLLHTGRLYCQHAESVAARNLQEFTHTLSQLQPDRHKIVVLAMFTNIVVEAGSINVRDVASRLSAIEACLKALVRDIT
jgi:hypothetical protein